MILNNSVNLFDVFSESIHVSIIFRLPERLFCDKDFVTGGTSIHYLEHWLAERKERLAKEQK